MKRGRNCLLVKTLVFSIVGILAVTSLLRVLFNLHISFNPLRQNIPIFLILASLKGSVAQERHSLKTSRHIDIERADKRSFTLIELLIVIAIIGILASAILPRFTSFNISARDATSRANLSALRGALIQYRAAEGDWPVNINSLAPVYIERIPQEFLNVSTGSNVTINAGNDTLFTGNRGPVGGWVYGNYITGGTANTTHGVWGRSIMPRSATQAGGTGSTANW